VGAGEDVAATAMWVCDRGRLASAVRDVAELVALVCACRAYSFGCAGLSPWSRFAVACQRTLSRLQRSALSARSRRGRGARSLSMQWACALAGRRAQAIGWLVAGLLTMGRRALHPALAPRRDARPRRGPQSRQLHITHCQYQSGCLVARRYRGAAGAGTRRHPCRGFARRLAAGPAPWQPHFVD
jgi:hypothetical protein